MARIIYLAIHICCGCALMAFICIAPRDKDSVKNHVRFQCYYGISIYIYASKNSAVFEGDIAIQGRKCQFVKADLFTTLCLGITNLDR